MEKRPQKRRKRLPEGSPFKSKALVDGFPGRENVGMTQGDFERFIDLSWMTSLGFFLEHPSTDSWQYEPSGDSSGYWPFYGYRHDQLTCSKALDEGAPTIIVAIAILVDGLTLVFRPCWHCRTNNVTDCAIGQVKMVIVESNSSSPFKSVNVIPLEAGVREASTHGAQIPDESSKRPVLFDQTHPDGQVGPITSAPTAKPTSPNNSDTEPRRLSTPKSSSGRYPDGLESSDDHTVNTMPVSNDRHRSESRCPPPVVPQKRIHSTDVPSKSWNAAVEISPSDGSASSQSQLSSYNNMKSRVCQLRDEADAMKGSMAKRIRLAQEKFEIANESRKQTELRHQDAQQIIRGLQVDNDRLNATCRRLPELQQSLDEARVEVVDLRGKVTKHCDELDSLRGHLRTALLARGRDIEGLDDTELITTLLDFLPEPSSPVKVAMNA